MRRQILLSILCLFAISNFAQRSVTQSWYVKDYTEQDAKTYFDNATYLIPIEGIWQSNDGFKYAIEKDVEDGKRLSAQFRMIVLESSSNGWSRGQIKGFIQLGSVDGAYSMKYYTRMANGTNTETQQVILMQENSVLMCFTRIDNGSKIALYRLYPQASDDEQQEANSSFTGDEKQWSGSGIAIASKYVATNFHVVEDAKTLIVTGVNGNTNKNYDIEVVATDKYNDLAILKIIDNSFNGFPSFRYGFSTATKDLGTDVFVLGYPLITTMGEDIKLTNGIISSKTGFQGDVSLYQISAPVQPGNSGGPLFDDNGDLIGIVNAKHNGAENVGYAIKLNYLKTLIESADLQIPLTSNNSIRTLPLKDKVKAISPMVVMIKANVSSASVNKPIVTKKYNTSPTPTQIAKAEELYNKTLEAMKVGETEEAYKYIRQSNDIYITEQSMLFQGYLAASLNKMEEAIEAYEYCYNKDFRTEYVALELGKLYSEIDKDKAITYFTKCINLNSHNIDAYFGRALVQKESNWEAALRDYKQVIKYGDLLEDNFSNRYHIATSYNNIAYGYMCLGIIDNRVDENITAALERVKIMDFMWDTDGEYAYKAGDYERCINSMNNAIAIAKVRKNKERANSYLYRGLAYLKLGNTLHAYLDFEKAVELKDSVAQEEIKKIDVSTLDFSEEQESKMIKRPASKNNKANYLTLEAIEQTDECTILYFSSETTQYTSYSINEQTYIRDTKTGIKYPLIAAENCAISKLSISTPYKNGKARFQLYFPKLPNTTTIIDFIEPNESEWKIYGINFTKTATNKPQRQNETNSKESSSNVSKKSPNDIIVTDKTNYVSDMQYVATITKTSGWGDAASELGVRSAIDMLKKEAAKQDCDVVLITNVYRGSTTSVTGQFYKRI